MAEMREFRRVACRCSHIKADHFIDKRGKTVCRSAACGCAEFRPKESA